jgi:hypothetical protein
VIRERETRAKVRKAKGKKANAPAVGAEAAQIFA